MRRFWLAFLLVLLGTTPAFAQGDPSRVVLSQDRVWGAADAPILVVEYSSLTCPHCAASHQTVLPTLVERYVNQGAVKLVVRPFPLDSVALGGALLSYCLPEAAYYPYTKSLYERQDRWSASRDPEAELVALAAPFGLSAEDAAACLADEATQTLVANYALQAQQSLDVRSTPSYFVNGTPSRSSGLLAAVEAALPADFEAVAYEAPWLADAEAAGATDAKGAADTGSSESEASVDSASDASATSTAPSRPWWRFWQRGS